VARGAVGVLHAIVAHSSATAGIACDSGSERGNERRWGRNGESDRRGERESERERELERERERERDCDTMEATGGNLCSFEEGDEPTDEHV
jgi:hypothetical protein